MYNGFIEREAALAVCPNAWCRRGGRCAAITGGQPAYKCQRTHEDIETARENLANKLDALIATFTPKPNRKPLSDYEIDLAMAELKEEIHAIDAAATAKQMAAAKASAASSSASVSPPSGAAPHPRRGGTTAPSRPRRRGNAQARGDMR